MSKKVEGGASGQTAQEVMGAHKDGNAADQERLAKVPETAVEYIDYAAALKNYEDREDVEPLAQRRAREAGTKFTDADFRRRDEGTAVVTSAKDGNDVD